MERISLHCNITKMSQLWRTIYISIFERGSRERYPVYKESYIGEDTRINLVLPAIWNYPPPPPPHPHPCLHFVLERGRGGASYLFLLLGGEGEKWSLVTGNQRITKRKNESFNVIAAQMSTRNVRNK
jgi:hypothetical protein